MTKSKKKELVTSLNDLSAQLSSLLEIDHPFGQRHIADARRVVEEVDSIRVKLNTTEARHQSGSDLVDYRAAFSGHDSSYSYSRLLALDLHGIKRKFKHIFRGQSRRHQHLDGVPLLVTRD